MTATRKTFAIAALPCLLLLAGCAETTFQDTLGMGKSAPDETRVRTVQPLSVPPDLGLRPPAAGGGETAQTAAASGSPGALAAPPGDDAGISAPAGNSAARAQAPAPARTAAASGDSSFYDIYRKHGIDLYRPDGKRKPISQLNRELAEKLKEERRRKNPRYGSIFNIDSLWKD